MGSTHEALEHAEHAQHHGAHGNTFEKGVGMSMSIVAALLAVVTLLSHRSHNETLRLVSEANRLQSEAATKHTLASDAWNEYQAKKQRMYQFKGLSEQLAILSTTPAAEKKAQEWAKQSKKNDDELPLYKAKGEKLG